MNASEPFPISLNTSTIRGAKLPLDEELQIAATAGCAAVEPWIEEIEAYVASGRGSTRDVRRRIEDLGLEVAGAVGFAEWVVPDAARRAAGLERMKRDMDLVAQIGGRHIAAPPFGAHRAEDPHPYVPEIGQRYRAILDLGRQTGVTPILELWGFSPTLSRLGEVVHAAAESGHTDACLLLDSYHLYKGGSSFDAIQLLNGASLPVFHINDYPGTPPRESIDDSDRVYPGDGVAPLPQLFRTLRAIGFKGYLSVELFNPHYWKQPPAEVAKRAIEKTRAAVRASLS
jgi:sugar phosphate isomerase/epimerase